MFEKNECLLGRSLSLITFIKETYATQSSIFSNYLNVINVENKHIFLQLPYNPCYFNIHTSYQNVGFCNVLSR